MAVCCAKVLFQPSFSWCCLTRWLWKTRHPTRWLWYRLGTEHVAYHGTWHCTDWAHIHEVRWHFISRQPSASFREKSVCASSMFWSCLLLLSLAVLHARTWVQKVVFTKCGRPTIFWNILNFNLSREELAGACIGLEADILTMHIRLVLHICVVAGDVNFGSAAVPCFRPEEVVIQNQKTVVIQNQNGSRVDRPRSGLKMTKMRTLFWWVRWHVRWRLVMSNAFALWCTPTKLRLQCLLWRREELFSRILPVLSKCSPTRRMERIRRSPMPKSRNERKAGTPVQQDPCSNGHFSQRRFVLFGGRNNDGKVVKDEIFGARFADKWVTQFDCSDVFLRNLRVSFQSFLASGTGADGLLFYVAWKQVWAHGLEPLTEWELFMRRVHPIGLEFARSDTVCCDAVECIRSVSDFGPFGLRGCDNKVVRLWGITFSESLLRNRLLSVMVGPGVGVQCRQNIYSAQHFLMHSLLHRRVFICCQSVQLHIDFMHLHGSSHEAHCLRFAQKHSFFIFIAQCGTFLSFFWSSLTATWTCFRRSKATAEWRHDRITTSYILKAGSICNAWISQGRNSKNFGHVAADRIKRWHWSPKCLLVHRRWLQSSSSHWISSSNLRAERRIFPNPIDECWRDRNYANHSGGVARKAFQRLLECQRGSILSDSWTGFAKFTSLSENLLQWYLWSARRLTKIQGITRANYLCPEIWSGMSKVVKKKEKQQWESAKPKFDNARTLRGIYFIEREIGKDKETIQNLRKMKLPMEAAMPCMMGTRKRLRELQEIAVRRITEFDRKTKYACIVEAHECTRKRLESTLLGNHAITSL